MGKVNTNIFIQKSIIKHGDKYDYSRVEYKGVYSKVLIICKKHGEFLQSYRLHVERGCGCPECGKITKKINNTTLTTDFIIKCNKIHNNKYKYKIDTDRIKLREDIINICCPKHGWFEQLGRQHLNQKQGCKLCAYEIKMNTEKFIEKSKKLFTDLFTYQNTNYIKNDIEIDISCVKHGDIKITPTDHFRIGCLKCGHNRMEHNWLDSMNVPDDKLHRQVRIELNNRVYKVDGIIDKTIYSFNGDYWHGNPQIYEKDKINTRMSKTFGELYKKTLKYEDDLRNAGYFVISIWESDFLKQKKLENIQKLENL